MKTYSVYHSGRLRGTGRSSGPHESYTQAVEAAQASAVLFGADQVIRDDSDEYRQWSVSQWGGRPIRVDILPPAPPDDPTPAPSPAQELFARVELETLQVLRAAGRTDPCRLGLPSRSALRDAGRTARRAVVAQYGAEWLDAQGRPLRVVLL